MTASSLQLRRPRAGKPHPKWQRFRDILAKVLTEKYQDLHDADRQVTRAGIAQTLQTLFTPNRFSQLT